MYADRSEYAVMKHGSIDSRDDAIVKGFEFEGIESSYTYQIVHSHSSGTNELLTSYARCLKMTTHQLENITSRDVRCYAASGGDAS